MKFVERAGRFNNTATCECGQEVCFRCGNAAHGNVRCANVGDRELEQWIKKQGNVRLSHASLSLPNYQRPITSMWVHWQTLLCKRTTKHVNTLELNSKRSSSICHSNTPTTHLLSCRVIETPGQGRKHC